MLHDFGVTIAAFITIMGSVLAQDAQQLSSTVANIFHPATTSQTEPAAAAATASPPLSTNSNPFHDATSGPAIAASNAQSSAAAIVDAPSQPSVEVTPQHPGHVLGATTEAPMTQQLPSPDFVKHDQLDTALNNLHLEPAPSFSFSGPAASTPVSTATFAQLQKIDNLGNVTITNATVDGVSGLTDADIPDGITASNYLPLSGGALTGDLSLSGTLTAGTLSVAGISSAGALIHFRQLVILRRCPVGATTIMAAVGTDGTCHICHANRCISKCIYAAFVLSTMLVSGASIV